VCERVAATDPSAVWPQQDLAGVTIDEAALCDDAACAARAYRHGIELYRAVEARDPTNTDHALRRIHAQHQLTSKLHALRDPGALAEARAGLAAAIAWVRAAPSDAVGPLLVAHGKVRLAQVLAAAPGGAVESRQLAGEALAVFRATSDDSMQAEFHGLK